MSNSLLPLVLVTLLAAGCTTLSAEDRAAEANRAAVASSQSAESSRAAAAAATSAAQDARAAAERADRMFQRSQRKPSS